MLSARGEPEEALELLASSSSSSTPLARLEASAAPSGPLASLLGLRPVRLEGRRSPRGRWGPDMATLRRTGALALVGLALTGICAATASGLLRPSDGSTPVRLRPLVRVHSAHVSQVAFEAKAAETGAPLDTRFVKPGQGTTSPDDTGCSKDVQLNDFSSKEAMEVAGWWFNWTDDFTFKPPIYRGFVPPESYWGFSMHGHGAITLRAVGSGVLTLDFGNLLGTPGSRVSALLNLERRGSAEPSTLSKTVEIAFEPEDALSIIEDPRGIIVINSIKFRCLPAPVDLHVSGEVERAEGKWKKEYASLQNQEQLAQARGKEHILAHRRSKELGEVANRFAKEVTELEEQHRQGEERARVEAERQRKENERLASALEAMLTSETEKTRLKALMAQDAEATREPLQEAMKQEALAKEVAAQAQQVGNSGEQQEAEMLVREAKEAQVREKQELDAQQNLTARLEDLKRNKTAAVKALKEAMDEEQRSVDELQDAERKEEVLERREAAAADVVKEAMERERKKFILREEAKQKKKALEEAARAAKAEQEQKDMQRQASKENMHVGDTLKFRRPSVQADDKYPAEMKDNSKVTVVAMVDGDQVSARFPDDKTYNVKYVDLYNPDITTTTIETTSTSTEKRITLYCFALMLPFGYEPTLLSTQLRKGVGIFACDEFCVFSNSSILVDTGKPSPLSVSLVDISLSVPYGGKWHTALNTGIFNKIWQEVVSLGRYSKHDWVVKADSDTVFFPDRLKEVLQHGLPSGLLHKAAVARRLSQDSASCDKCRLPGQERDSCSDHAKWLQNNKQLSCGDALAQVARPPPVDCGCDCSRLEACDLSLDESWAKDGGLIRGHDLQEMRSEDVANAPIYINNCRFGLHGPIEVLTRTAVNAYVQGLPKCEFLLDQPWGEDKYLDRCMLRIGVTRANVFGILSETACGEEPAPCGGPAVAFHPFKNAEDYFACWDFAQSYGHGPVEEVRRKQARQASENVTRSAGHSKARKEHASEHQQHD